MSQNRDRRGAGCDPAGSKHRRANRGDGSGDKAAGALRGHRGKVTGKGVERPRRMVHRKRPAPASSPHRHPAIRAESLALRPEPRCRGRLHSPSRRHGPRDRNGDDALTRVGADLRGGGDRIRLRLAGNEVNSVPASGCPRFACEGLSPSAGRPPCGWVVGSVGGSNAASRWSTADLSTAVRAMDKSEVGDLRAGSRWMNSEADNVIHDGDERAAADGSETALGGNGCVNKRFHSASIRRGSPPESRRRPLRTLANPGGRRYP